MRKKTVLLSVAWALTTALPIDAGAKKMSKGDWKATCKKPSPKQIATSSKMPGAARVQSYSRVKALGGKRFAVVVGLRNRSKELPRLYLVVLEKKGKTWQVDRKLLADYDAIQRKHKVVPLSDECRDGTRILVSLYTSDYDADGHPEIKVRHRFKGCDPEDDPERPTPLTRLQIFNVAPLRSAVDTTIKTGSGPGIHDSWKTRLTHNKDLDGDGHPDLTITFHGEDFANNLGKVYHEKVIRIYHWKAAGDRYVLKSTKKSSWVKAQDSW